LAVKRNSYKQQLAAAAAAGAREAGNSGIGHSLHHIDQMT